MIFRSRIWIAFLLFTLFSACREKKDVPPPVGVSSDSLISPQIMIMILADVHVAEAALMLERNEGLESKDKPGKYYQGIFKKYGISHERYDQNLTVYRENPENFAKMYEKVIELLEIRQRAFSEAKKITPWYKSP
jgi:Domain of unknown function (DUF4296)